jgi:hypothetical protein
MKTLKLILSTLEFVDTKDLLKPTKIFWLFISSLFLYWGLVNNLLYPILDVLSNPSLENVTIMFVRLFLLSGFLTLVGLALLLMTITKNNPK